ncbi:hypothetical protein [Moraxella lacunata]
MQKLPQQITVWHRPSLFVSVTFVNYQKAKFLKICQYFGRFFMSIFYAM